MSTKQNLQQVHSISNPETLYDPTPNGYSHLATVTPDSTLIFVAGQGGEDGAGNYDPNFRVQVRQAFQNVQKALQEKECEVKNIVKLTTLIVDYDSKKHQILTEESERLWPDKEYPVQTLIPVPRLALDEMLFEVDAVAVK